MDSIPNRKYPSLKGNICRLRHLEHRLIVRSLLPSRANRLDLGLILRSRGIIDDQHLAADASRRSVLLARPALALPLPVDIKHTEPGREARRNFLVQELTPCRLTYTLLRRIGRPQPEIKLRVHPPGGLRRMGRVSLQGWSHGLLRRRGIARNANHQHQHGDNNS